LDFSNDKASFEDISNEVSAKTKEAQEDSVSVERLMQLNSEKEGGELSGPLFRVRYVQLAEKETDIASASADRSKDLAAATSLTTDMTLFYSPSSSTLSLSYNSLLFSAARSEHLLASLTLLIKQVASGKSTNVPIATIPLRTSEQTSILPDPKKDLDWCGFKGAITDIFHANAKRNPTNPCVIQSRVSEGSLSSGASTERLTFTYQQIDEASNILAHSLVEQGVERGEVVMVYAARSVELVVCVMGVLKAGAVFSVIGESWSQFLSEK
jgi:L-aminoadipate-semialdehyde dehydrogenase